MPAALLQRVERLAEQVERLGGTAAAVPPIGEWLAAVSPTWRWDWPHLRYLQRQLERVTRGEVTRLAVFMPPRHGKSEQTTVRYPMWRLERDPTLRVIVAAHTATLAEKFSRKARRIATGRIVLSRERAAAEDWETAAGGGLRAIGVGGAIAGHGGDLILIDDPIRSREEAESETVREKVWEWYTDDLRTRLEPGGAIVLIQTRWHEDDLAGRLLREREQGSGEPWEVVNLPAFAEENDPLGRAEGEALCTDRYPVEALERLRDVLGSYSFAALYQQRPAPREGGLFRRGWFQIVPNAPAGGRRVRYWDLAGSAGRGDYTVGTLLARVGDRYFVEDVIRGQWAPGERDEVIRTAAKEDGRAVAVWVEEEPGSAGKGQSAALIRLLAGYNVRAERATGSKEVRAAPLAAQAEAGNVFLVAGPWNRAWLDEVCEFPFGKNDDQVDSAAGGFGRLAAPHGPRLYSAVGPPRPY